MFIFTAKFSLKKAVVGLILLCVVVCGIIFAVGKFKGMQSDGMTASLVADTNEKRVEYLNSFGWEISAEPCEEQAILIPTEFSSVYKEYNNIQLEQGFDLTDYAGLDATRYTYEVYNYPGYSSKVLADLVIYDGRIIAGDVRATALDGFIQGLKMPS